MASAPPVARGEQKRNRTETGAVWARDVHGQSPLSLGRWTGHRVVALRLPLRPGQCSVGVGRLRLTVRAQFSCPPTSQQARWCGGQRLEKRVWGGGDVKEGFNRVVRLTFR